MKFIRWKAVIPLTVIAVITVIFVTFFMDSILKSIIISICQNMFAAKVEIASLDTKVNNLSIKIKGLQVADKTDEWKNLFEVNEMRFAMRFKPLLSKKVVIDEMAIDTISWGTTRKTSGKLPPRKLKKIEKENAKQDDTIAKLRGSLAGKLDVVSENMPLAQTLKGIGDIKSISVSKIMGDTPLESVTAINALSEESKQKYEIYKSSIDNINTDESVKQAKEIHVELSSIKTGNVQEVQDAQKKLASANEKKKDIDKTINQISTLKAGLTADFADKQDITNKINGLISKDYQNLTDKVKLGKIDKGSVAQAVFGRAWFGRINKFLHYVEIARKYMPPRSKTSKKIEVPRLKGTDVVFFKEEILPGLLIKKISVSGTTGGEGKDNANANALTVQGAIVDICSDQVLYGRPTKADIAGNNPKAKYIVAAVFDHTKEIAEDSIRLDIENYNANELNLQAGEYFPNIEKAKVVINTEFIMKADELDCTIKLGLSSLVLGKLSNEFLNDVYSGLQAINADLRIHGKMDALQTDFDSNLDDVVVNKIKTLYAKKEAELKAQIKAGVDSMVSEQKTKALNEYNARREELLKVVQGKQAQVEEEKNKIEAMIQEKQNEITGNIDKEKKAKEEELKKQAEQKLNNLFKK